MNRELIRALTCSGGALAIFTCAHPCQAEQASLEIESVVVTAQKRPQGLQNVPIAITVVSGENLQRMSVRNLEEVSLTTPGFHINQSPSQSGANLRGIGSGSNNPGFQQSVGVFVDGVYSRSERLFQMPFLDVAQIEVLKGPQTVVLGKNTTAGAINITTARPTDHREGSFSALYGENGEYAATAVLSGPVADGLVGRVAARAAGTDGYLKNTFTHDNETRSRDAAVRGSLQWQALDDLSVYTKLEYTRSRQVGNALAVSLLTPAQLAADRTFDPDIVADDESLTKSADGRGLPNNEEYNNLTSTDFTAIADYDFSDWTLTSVTGVGRLRYEQGTDADHQPSPLSIITLQVASNYEQFSEELRVASRVGEKFEFLGGVYYQSSDIKFADWTPCVAFAAVPGAGRPTAFCAPARFEQDQSTRSVFARETWNITEKLRANVGVRYTHEDTRASNRLTITELDRTTINADPFDLQIARGVGGWAPHTIPRTARTEANWSPSYSVQYDVVPDVMAYGSFTRGAKAGGFNPLNGTGAPGAWQFGPETAESYEAGIKAKLFEQRAALNVAAFSSRFEDLQVSQFDGVTFIVSNASAAKVDGVELDFRVRTTAALTLGGNVSYLDSRYGTFRTAPCRSGQTPATGCVGGVQNLSGEPLPFAPHWSASFDAEYARQITSNLMLSLQGNLFYMGEHFLAPDNDLRAVQERYTKIDARVALGNMPGRWEVALIGKNLTDEITKTFANDVLGNPGAFFAHVSPGRTLAVQGTVRF